MLGLSRRFTAALLWIAIALLPVRGFASVMMPIAMGGMQPTAVASAPAAEPAMAAMPCHAASQDDPKSADGTPSTCAMCDLCHTSAVQIAQTRVVLPEQHEALPHAAPAAPIEPRAPDGLFRPPRTALA